MTSSSPLLIYLQSTSPSFRNARLAALYADFSPLRTLNPDGYNANTSAWHQGLSSAALAGLLPSSSTLILSLDPALYQALETKEWGRPLAVGTVVEEGIQKRELVVLKEFLEAKESVFGRGRWRVPGIGEVLGWGLKQLGLGFVTRGKEGAKVVLVGNLQAVGKEFEGRVKGIRGRTERVWSLRAFKETYRDLLSPETGLSDADFEVLLRYLQRDQGIVSWDGETVKLRSPGEIDAVTAEDATIADLKTLIADLEVQTRVLEDRVDGLNRTARQAVEKKNRVAALAALRSKKLAEGTLAKRHATLGQLEEVFSSIEQAADQVELVGIMEGSTKVLEGLNKQVGGAERVNDVVDGLREQMGQVNEVGDVIAEAGQTGVDETEVDDELEALEAEEQRKTDEVERIEREERQWKEAEETMRRLGALGEVERAAKEKAAAEKADADKQVDESEQLLKRMSLDPPEKVTA